MVPKHLNRKIICTILILVFTSATGMAQVVVANKVCSKANVAAKIAIAARPDSIITNLPVAATPTSTSPKQQAVYYYTGAYLAKQISNESQKIILKETATKMMMLVHF
ncbi:MAG: hypothetical protein H7211_13165 [Aquabacterium sp.]|nr:hypothetical protein [Ferruginibacter sp.]